MPDKSAPIGAATVPKSTNKEPKQPSIRTAILCVVLGVLCFGFAIIGWLVEPGRMPEHVGHFSFAMGCGLFLTAVGGYAFGKWQGWTFGGAAALVVGLYLLMNVNGEEPPVRTTALDLKISGSDFFDHIQSVEVTDDENRRLFVAPDRTLNHLRVLVEKRNLAAGCIAFSFVPKLGLADAQGDPEPYSLLVPSEYFMRKLQSVQGNGQAWHRVPLVFEVGSRAMFDKPPRQGEPRPPLNAPDLCDEFSQVASLDTGAKPGFWSGFMSAHAGTKSSAALIAKLDDRDAFVRRAAREQIAALGPRIVPELMQAIPREDQKSHYRYALGAMVSVANMAKQYDVDRIRSRMTQQDYQVMSALMGHSDKTLRKWATAAIVRLGGEDSLDALFGSLESNRLSDTGRYNTTFALGEISKKLPTAAQKAVTDRIKFNGLAKTRSLKVGVGNAADELGWVFLGVKYGDAWGERNFDWKDASEDQAPVQGDVIVANTRVNLRQDHHVFDAKAGWSESPVLELVTPGRELTVVQVQEVIEGYYWAEVN